MIYDCFIFGNEIDLLDIRLHTLNDVVDKFVIVEAYQDFRGQPKPLNFEREYKRFKQFLSKIIYVTPHLPVIEHNMKDNETEESINFKREFYQRNRIINGLSKAKEGDIVVITDSDEIPNPECIIRYQRENRTVPIRIRQRHFLYKLNYELVGQGGNIAPVICRFSDQLKYPDSLRHIESEIFDNGGWHFSHCGDERRIKESFETFSHMEYNFNTSGKFVDIDGGFPKYVVDNKEKFKHLIGEKNLYNGG